MKRLIFILTLITLLIFITGCPSGYVHRLTNIADGAPAGVAYNSQLYWRVTHTGLIALADTPDRDDRMLVIWVVRGFGECELIHHGLVLSKPLKLSIHAYCDGVYQGVLSYPS